MVGRALRAPGTWRLGETSRRPFPGTRMARDLPVASSLVYDVAHDSSSARPLRLTVELPAAIAMEMLAEGRGTPARSLTRSVESVVADITVAVVGATGPTMLIAIAAESGEAIARRLWLAVRGRGDQQVRVVLRWRDGSANLSVETKGPDALGQLGAFASAVDDILAERSSRQ